MSAVEEIQQAIATLERLRAESTPGPWVLGQFGAGVTQSFERAVQVSPYKYDRVGIVSWEHIRDEDARLIVTLHRTIDAQIGVLSDALSVYQDPIPAFIGHEEQVIHHQLMLARAITGGAS